MSVSEHARVCVCISNVENIIISVRGLPCARLMYIREKKGSWRSSDRYMVRRVCKENGRFPFREREIFIER